MLKKLNTGNMFSFENHEETSGEDLPEQGTVTTADTEEVVAEATPSEDVTEAGDDVGQATPNDVIDAEPDADITTTETTEIVEDSTVDGAANSDAVEEVNKLTEEGEQAAATTRAIVETATNEVESEGGGTDVNGNAITEEQAVENEEEEVVDETVDAEAEQTAADKDIREQAEDVAENVDEEIGDAIGDDSSDGGVDGEVTDDTSTDIDSGGDAGDLGMDADLGGEGNPEGGDDGEALDSEALDADDTPLEGAEDAQLDGDTTDTGDTDVVDSESTEVDDVDVDESEAGDSVTEEDTTGDLEGSDVESVSEQVEDQNLAADVTAEAASADAEQTDFIAGDTPEQHGEEPADDTVPNDGEEVIAEAAPAVQNETDVSTANATADIDGNTATVDDVELDDDTPLEGAEDLGINDEASLTETEVDGQEATGPTGDGATVEESISDQEGEATEEVVDTEVDESADGSETEETEVVEDGDTSVGDEGEEAVGLDAEAGEIEETDEEADLEEGELDIPDVDVDTTEEEVEEAEFEADEIEAEADAEEAKAEVGEKTIEELQNEAESLEEYRYLLEKSIASESYDAVALAIWHANIDDTRQKLNAAGFRFGNVALESYGAPDLDLAYVASLESVNSMLGAMTKVRESLIGKVRTWYSKAMVDKVKARTSALNKQIDVCLVNLKKADVSTKDVSGIGAYLSHGEGNLTKSVAEDLKLVGDIASKGFKANETVLGYVVKGLNDIASKTSPAEAVKVANGLAGFKDAKAAYPDKAFSTGFLGGYKLQLKEATGGSELKDKVLNMARRAVPVVVREGKGKNTTQKLSKGDVANLLTMAKAYVALADKLATTVGDRAVDKLSDLKAARSKAAPAVAEGKVRGGDEKAISAACDAAEIISKANHDLYKFITKHCIDVADALCGVAKKVTK